MILVQGVSPVGVIHGGVALEVGDIQQLCLEPNGTVLQISEPIAKVHINRSCLHNFICQGIQLRLMLQIIYVQLDFDTTENILNQLRIAVDCDTLIESVEIIVIKSQSHRQTLTSPYSP